MQSFGLLNGSMFITLFFNLFNIFKTLIFISYFFIFVIIQIYKLIYTFILFYISVLLLYQTYRWFEYGIILVIIFNSICLALYDFDDRGNTT